MKGYTLLLGIRIIKASYNAIEQIFVAKFYIFLSQGDYSGYPLGSHFLGRTILQAAMTPTIGRPLFGNARGARTSELLAPPASSVS